MSNKPKIYATCKSGCEWETVHKDDFLRSASIVKLAEGNTAYLCDDINATYKLVGAGSASAWIMYNDADGEGYYAHISISAIDKYRNYATFQFLAVEKIPEDEIEDGDPFTHNLVYELNGEVVTKKTIMSSIDESSIKLRLNGVGAIYLYNEQATITAKDGDKGEKGDKGDKGNDAIGYESYRFDIIPQTTVFGTAYIQQTGELTNSGSWECLRFNAKDLAIIERASLWTNTTAFYLIAFYSSETPSAEAFISGLKPSGITGSVKFTFENVEIPDGAVSVLFSYRKATGTDIELVGVGKINHLEEKAKLDNLVSMHAQEKNEPNEVVYQNFACENDFTIVNDEIWSSKNESTYTRILRYKIVDGVLSKLGEITLSDAIHLNVLDYSPENDCLITGNGANDFNTEGNHFWIIPNASKLQNCDYQNRVSLADIAIRYDVDIGYKVQALWGHSNCGKHNVVYLLSNNGELRKAIIHRNEDGSFSNSYTLIGDKIDISNNGEKFNMGFQGAAYFGGYLYFGYGGVNTRICRVSNVGTVVDFLDFATINDDGTEFINVIQGIAVDKKYYWIYVLDQDRNNTLVRIAR